MAASGGPARQQGLSFFQRQVLLQAALYCTVVLVPGVLGWLTGLMAVPAARLLAIRGVDETLRVVGYGCLAGGTAALFTGRIGVFLFSLSFLPLAFVLARGWRQGEDPVVSGSRGLVVLVLLWGGFWALYGLGLQINPYVKLVRIFDQGFLAIGQMYSESGQLDPEQLARLHLVIEEIRRIFPRILPGLLGCGVLITVWMNQVVFSAVMVREPDCPGGWPPYRQWKLPDWLVWLVIAGGVLLIVGHGMFHSLALNLLLLGGTLYCFQGLAVLVHLFKRWSVPRPLRILMYLLLIVQSYGLILIAVLGLADIWLALRSDQTGESRDGS